MKLEPQQPGSAGTGAGGAARLVAGLAVVTLAIVAILVVADVIPRSMLTEVASKTLVIGGICLVAALALAALSRR
jgi:hypothetical protein